MNKLDEIMSRITKHFYDNEMFSNPTKHKELIDQKFTVDNLYLAIFYIINHSVDGYVGLDFLKKRESIKNDFLFPFFDNLFSSSEKKLSNDKSLGDFKVCIENGISILKNSFLLRQENNNNNNSINDILVDIYDFFDDEIDIWILMSHILFCYYEKFLKKINLNFFNYKLNKNEKKSFKENIFYKISLKKEWEPLNKKMNNKQFNKDHQLWKSINKIVIINNFYNFDRTKEIKDNINNIKGNIDYSKINKTLYNRKVDILKIKVKFNNSNFNNNLLKSNVNFDYKNIKRIIDNFNDESDIDFDKYNNYTKRKTENQLKFRENCILVYKKCLLTNISFKPMLIASHIIPWNQCNKNKFEEKKTYAVTNSLLLSSNVDKLFDKNFISFDEGGYLFINENKWKENDHSISIEKINNILKNIHIDNDFINRKKSIFDYIEQCYLDAKKELNYNLSIVDLKENLRDHYLKSKT